MGKEIFGALADNFEKMAFAQYGIDLKSDNDAKEFAQTGAMNSFITGKVMGPLNDQDITPQQALEAVNKEAMRIGLNPKTGLQMFNETMQTANNAAKANGLALSASIKAGKAQLDAKEQVLDIAKKKQDIIAKTPEGKEQIRIAEDITPGVNVAINNLEAQIKEIGTRDIEELIDELDYPGLERGLFGAFTNKAETAEQAAEIIAGQIIKADPNVASDPNALQTVKARVLQALIGKRDPQQVDVIKKTEPAIGLFHGN